MWDVHQMHEGANQEERAALSERGRGSVGGGRMLGGESFLSLNEVQHAVTFSKDLKT